MSVLRWLLVALGLLALMGALGAIKGAQISTAMAAVRKAQAAGPPPETVNTATAESQQWDVTLASVGTVAASRGVMVSNDQAGRVARILFRSGAVVRAGQALVELDTRVERAQLAAAGARFTLARILSERTKVLVAGGAVPKDQLDRDAAALRQTAADAEALQEIIERKTVRAPFTGRLGLRLVDVGQELAVGTPIAILMSEAPPYVDFTLPQEAVLRAAAGMPVRLSGVGVPQDATGKVIALEPALDPSTRSLKLRASLAEGATWPRPGMFVSVTLVERATEDLVVVPATAVLHASYGDSIFVVEAGVATQRFVRTGRARGDFVSIASGVKAGEVVVSGGAFKLRNGARVRVNNEVGPKAELTPRPVNR